jgi:hypothetical protein
MAALALLVSLVVPPAVAAPAAAVVRQARGEVYRPPVVAEVIDPFRPPDEPWLPGNRGLEYQTEPGTVVWAIGSGLVVFAGPIAGRLYVTVLHGDGIRSSYSHLAAIHVSEGDRVRGGQPIGTTSDLLFHLGARVGSTYIDPASLFGVAVGRASVFLVPVGRVPVRDPAGRPDLRAGGPDLGAGLARAAGSLVASVGRLVAAPP